MESLINNSFFRDKMEQSLLNQGYPGLDKRIGCTAVNVSCIS